MIKQATPEIISAACQLLLSGDIVAIPTETVYGLAADASNDLAITKIYAVKQRPQFNPLIIHGCNIDHLKNYVTFNEAALKLATRFWPGPLTLVLPRRSESTISLLAGAGLDTLGVRVPNHPVALALLQHLGRPLAAPSANRSNTISPTSATDVLASLGERVPLILDGGATTVGLESTIVDMTTAQPTLLRPGGIAVEALEAIVGPIKLTGTTSAIKAPGMLKRHYAPTIPLRLNALTKEEGELHLGFGDIAGDVSLSVGGDLAEAATHLFRFMRDYDLPIYKGIAVAPIPTHGLGLAINDRLQRAATQEEEKKS